MSDDYWWDVKNYFLYASHHRWKEGKQHFLLNGMSPCGANVRLTKKKKQVNCVPCLEYLKANFPHCPKCLFSETCQDCIAKKTMHLGLCLATKNIVTLKHFYQAPLQCKQCADYLRPKCNCGQKMVTRTSAYGKFWGCSQYPKCKYTLDYSKFSIPLKE